MSLNHYKKKNETRPPGCLWKAGWWSGGHPVSGTCIWYPVLGTWYLVPGTLYPVSGASTWSPSTWPHPRGCRTIAVAYLSVSIAAQQGWVQQIKGGRAVSGPRILSFQSQKKPKKTEILKRIDSGICDEWDFRADHLCASSIFHDEDSILYYAYWIFWCIISRLPSS